MQVGIVGLGRMGSGIADRLIRAGFDVHGYDPHDAAGDDVQGLRREESLVDLVRALKAPRRIWVMAPAGRATTGVIDVLCDLLERGDSLVDGGNSHYPDAIATARRFESAGIEFLDVGTSGGIGGRERGYSLMVGGTPQAVSEWSEVFRSLAPTPDTGWAHVGPSGAGHFAKMIHNGIEYGMMQAMAEGVAVLAAEGSPEVDLQAALRAWQDGSIITSALLDVLVRVVADNPDLEGIAPRVADSGEGRWAVAAALERNVSAPVITQALLERLRSRDDGRMADRVLAALRGGFGGHDVPKS